jgi:hypothetical protein
MISSIDPLKLFEALSLKFLAAGSSLIDIGDVLPD